MPGGPPLKSDAPETPAASDMDISPLASRSVLLVLGLTAVACVRPASVRVPDGPPTVRGAVVSVRHSATATGILVRPAGEACGLQAVADAQTRVLERSASGAVTEVGIGAVAVDDTVEVYVDGPVLESCPLQGRAGTVVLVARGEAASG